MSVLNDINTKLVPIKGHYLFFNAGTAPLVPYLSTYARQLGLSSSTVGLIYTVLPIFGLIAKPLFGLIADRFKLQKVLFIIFQVIIIVSFSGIYVIPDNKPNVSVDLGCDNGASILKTCYKSADEVNNCTVEALSSLTNRTSVCEMTCDVTSPKKWQAICEHWDIPQYCDKKTKTLDYISYMNNITLKDECVYVSANFVTFQGHTFKPSCHIGSGYVDINEPCTLACFNDHLASLIGDSRPNMTCLDNTVNYRLCDYNAEYLANVKDQPNLSQCQTSCEIDVDTPWKLMQICEGWGGEVANICKTRTSAGEVIPDSLSFDGTILLSTTQSEGECISVQLNSIKLQDGSVHYPVCESEAASQKNLEMLYSSCNISCDNEMVNDLFLSASEGMMSDGTEYTKQFWLFFAMMIISWVGQAVVVTFADAICFNLLGPQVSLYGRQRLWGSLGWGIICLLTGILIDVYSYGMYKDYTVAFILMFVFMCGDVIVSFFLNIESTRMALNILTDVRNVLATIENKVFILWTIAVGMCTALVWQFLFWLIEDIADLNCVGVQYVKTLQGLVLAIQIFCGEIPLMYLSGYILRKFGHANTMTLVLFAYGVRFILYSMVTNPWWIMPIEIFQGITQGMFYPAMTSYANAVSPPGTETTVQGLVGAVFEGVGTAIGSFIAGHLYSAYGGWKTFLWFGIGALIASVVHFIVQYLLKGDTHVVNAVQGNRRGEE